MKSVRLGRSVSARELHITPAAGCVSMCGMCPSCAFAADPPCSVQCPWEVSDDFKRRFLVGLLLKCRDINMLENIQRALGVTSWTLFTYTRSRSRTSPQHHPGPTKDRGQHGRPVGMDLNGIWSWFNSSAEWLKLRYLCRLFSFCDSELLHVVSNLTSVLLVREQRGVLLPNVSSKNKKQHHTDADEDSEDPALMVVPGSFRSVSGVSRYRDFIGCLHVDLAKRILGLLDEHTLRLCQKVCRYWQHLAQETMEEFKLARKFQDKTKAMMERGEGNNMVSPTYAKVIDVPVPAKDDEEQDIQPHARKLKPFAAAYAKIKTKTVQMEERNVYCGAYYTSVLLDKVDPHRVVDYRGRTLMATGSKDRVVNLLYVASQTKTLSVLKGHIGSIKVVFLCEDRDLLITASCDSSIRCWNLKTDACEMMLYGHTGAVNCLDVHAHKLVSGARDCLVKVWSLQTGKHLDDLNFKHSSPVQCVKITKTRVYSSCNRGFIKIWDVENGALLRMINAHKSAVKCLFLDEWHLLSGDCNGQVMAWSVSCDVQDSLMTFNHPKEVKSLTLVYLRVITGCADGRIRVFNFLTGDCLREIKAEAEEGCILSLHFHDNSILVNAKSSVKRYQFAKVFWDYTETTGRGRDYVVTQDLSTKVAPPGLMKHDCNNKPKRSEMLQHNSFPSLRGAQGRERCKSAESVLLSEKAASERIKKRGLHHPLTRDSILLRVSAMQRARFKDEVSINMECNARLRDSWGPHTSDTQINPTKPTQDADHRRPKTCVPVLRPAVSPSMKNTMRGRAQCHSADTCRPNRRVSGFIAERPRALVTRSLPNPERSVKTSTSLPRISPVSPVRERGGFRLITESQMEKCEHSKREVTLRREQNLTRKGEKTL
ncbi:CMT1A duplicated region transcript 1 protein [Notolabrus celidotus]|uniref:CMT1A duplicated region transcript 1 protein n=1 Tax=Notolabrus celidotus TaxID=1203425 RepID=UPI00148F7424|nr:CMT1A duplicated region transcript 1 protein [Notolabrus celidotus]